MISSAASFVLEGGSDSGGDDIGSVHTEYDTHRFKEAVDTKIVDVRTFESI